MPSPNAIAPPPSTARSQLLTVDSRLFCSKPFSFTHFRKNASANPLESHTFKTKDLKPFRFTHFQIRVGDPPCHWTPGLPRTFLRGVSSHERCCMRVPTPVGIGDSGYFRLS